MQKEVVPSHNLQDHTFEQQNPFGLKEDNPLQRNCHSKLNYPSLTHTEQECQEILIQE